MRIKIEPITGFFGESATQMSIDNHRLIDGKVISTVAYWSDGGKKLAEKDVELPPAEFEAWRKSEAKTSEAEFATVQMTAVGAVKKVEPIIEPPVIIPETPEEKDARLAQESKDAEERRLSDIAYLEQQLINIQSDIDALKSVKP